MYLETAKNLMEFFREKVKWVRCRQNIQLMEMTEFYLVNLLSEAIQAEGLDEPLALIYGRAIQSPSETEQFKLFKQVGDRSLYVSGFFGDSLAKYAVDIDYFISMGELAYSFTSSISEDQHPHRGLSGLFAELSQKFVRLVDLISEISESAGITSDQDLIRLYERWLATKSGRLLELLRDQGIIPVDTKRGLPH